MSALCQWGVRDTATGDVAEVRDAVQADSLAAALGGRPVYWDGLCEAWYTPDGCRSAVAHEAFLRRQAQDDARRPKVALGPRSPAVEDDGEGFGGFGDPWNLHGMTND